MYIHTSKPKQETNRSIHSKGGPKASVDKENSIYPILSLECLVIHTEENAQAQPFLSFPLFFNLQKKGKKYRQKEMRYICRPGVYIARGTNSIKKERKK